MRGFYVLMKRLFSVLSVVVLGFGLGLFGSDEVSAKSSTPTIFIHGLQGDNKSLSNLVSGMSGARQDDRYVYTYQFTNVFRMRVTDKIPIRYSGQRMTYVVRFDGKVVGIDMSKTVGNVKGKKDYNNGFSVIHFSNHSESLDDQETYLEAVIRSEMKRLNTKTVNLVGHSMGGLLASQYTIKSEAGDKRLTGNVSNLVTFGSPIAGASKVSNQLSPISVIGGAKAPADLYSGGKVLTKALKDKKVVINKAKVYSFSGKKDVFVPKASATALSKIVKKSNFKTKELNVGHTGFFDGTEGKKAVSELKKIIK